MRVRIPVVALMIALLLLCGCAKDDSAAQPKDIEQNGMVITLNENWEDAWNQYKDELMSRVSQTVSGMTVQQHKGTEDLLIMSAYYKKDYLHFEENFISKDLENNTVEGFNVYNKEESEKDGNKTYTYMLESDDGALSECIIIVDKDDKWHEVEIYSSDKDRLKTISDEIYDSIRFNE